MGEISQGEHVDLGVGVDALAAEGEVGVGPEQDRTGGLLQVEVAELEQAAQREARTGGPAEEERRGRVGASVEYPPVGGDGVVEGGGEWVLGARR